MATQKITITLPEEQVDAIRLMVGEGRASSISGFVQHAVRTALDEVALWQVTLAEALDASGGPLTDEERARIDAVLDGGSERSVA